MKLAVSNIAWNAVHDNHILSKLPALGYTGLEIAPTRIFPHLPYNNLSAVEDWRKELHEKYSLIVPSMQSIWYGRSEKLFGSDEERLVLTSYTKKAIDFAAVLGCRNLVFGCPKNRVLPSPGKYELGIDFFRQIAEYAKKHGTVIGLEANPNIYGTNYINTTREALDLLQEVNHPGLRLNLDVGTMIANNESVELLVGQAHLLSHVHISEPYLKPIAERQEHKKLADLLRSEGYNGFVSIEMGKVEDLKILFDKMAYVKEIFGFH